MAPLTPQMEKCRRELEKTLRKYKLRGVIFMSQPINLDGRVALRGAVAHVLEPLSGEMAVTMAKLMEAKLAPIFAAMYRYGDVHAHGASCCGCVVHKH